MGAIETIYTPVEWSHQAHASGQAPRQNARNKRDEPEALTRAFTLRQPWPAADTAAPAGGGGGGGAGASDLGPAGALTRVLCTKPLKRLSLASNFLGGNGVAFLAAALARHAPALTTLNLSQNNAAGAGKGRVFDAAGEALGEFMRSSSMHASPRRLL